MNFLSTLYNGLGIVREGHAEEERQATSNYLNKDNGNPQGVDPAAVQTNRVNQTALEGAQQTQHLTNLNTFLSTLSNADSSVGPAPAPLPDNATVEQQNQHNQLQAQYTQAVGQARQQAWEQAARVAPALGIDPAHVAGLQQDFLTHGSSFANQIQTAVQAHLTPNSTEIVGTPGGTQDANGNTVLVTRGGQTRTLQGVAPTSSVDANAHIASAENIAANNDRVQREGIQERRDATAAAHPTAGAGASIAQPILESAVPAAIANIDGMLRVIDSSPLFRNDSRGMLAARAAELQVPGSTLNAYVDGLKHQLALIDLRALRQSGFSLGRVTNTEFTAAASGMANLNPALPKAELQTNLNRVRGHLERFQTALQGDIAAQAARTTPAASAATGGAAAVNQQFGGAPQFQNGQVYQDANGNKATYNNGNWTPVQ